MRLLLDTHVLLWAALGSSRLSPVAAALVEDAENTLFFSAASLWELAIKQSLGRADFDVDIVGLQQALLDAGYIELPVNGAHAVAVAQLPLLHKDPFDRLLLAQALIERMLLVTADQKLAAYPGSVKRV